MTINKQYYIEKEIAKNLRGAIPQTLFSIILTAFAVVREQTGVDYRDMMHRFKLDHETTDAVHMAAHLIYEETAVINVSRRVISALFGRTSDHLVRRAQIKEQQLQQFRAKMRVVRQKYQEISLRLYDEEIPF